MEKEKKWLVSNGWKLSTENGFKKTFKFNNFSESINFVNLVATKAEELEHHPDIKISYDKVTMRCITHDERSVTMKDIRLAIDIQKIYEMY